MLGDEIKNNIVFRVDASEDIGIGHLMRCLALSEELLKRNYTCYFLSNIQNEYLLEKLKDFNVSYIKIKSNDTENDDITELLDFTMSNNCDWVITDHYGISNSYLKKLKEKKLNILSMDDNAQIKYPSDVVLNQNSYAERMHFSSEPYTKYLLGSKYVLLQDRILRREEKKERKAVNKILITLGGTSFNDLILKILTSLQKIVKEDIEIFVILGPFNQSFDIIKKFTEKTDINVKLFDSPKNMTDIYLDTDIAISAGGTSCYELAYFGIPNAVITVAENQINIAKDLSKRNVSLYSGDIEYFKEEKFIQDINKLLERPELRNEMSNNGRRLIDGKGKMRIVDFMERYN
ncbi:MAG: UDP-2,4-diacetamido-2,4,6-trideoxy-beta-L-altropyranose hydrolase [Thermoplasmatales archaeon]|nr:MAG: UDP-2,4-diacetamido-2,4,6-trideoxy-beta-L-altropyranose hydrolase [Thermoplasmatales archaeon]